MERTYMHPTSDLLVWPDEALDDHGELVVHTWEFDATDRAHRGPFAEWRAKRSAPVLRMESFEVPKNRPTNFLHGSPISEEFARLAEEWRSATMSSSILTDIVLHPAYQRIIGLGPAVVPLILADLRDDVELWFWALRSITGFEPTGVEPGNMAGMRDAWLDWGYSMGLIEDRKAS